MNEAQQTGEWGMKIVLPCRYDPGPLANDPANFYSHTWWAILDGSSNSIDSNDNFQDSDSDYSLTLVKLNPILARYDYLCGIVFSNNDTSIQPYDLRSSSSSDVQNAIDVIISKIEGEDIKSFHYLSKQVYFYAMYLFTAQNISFRWCVYWKRTK